MIFHLLPIFGLTFFLHSFENVKIIYFSIGRVLVFEFLAQKWYHSASALQAKSLHLLGMTYLRTEALPIDRLEKLKVVKLRQRIQY